MEFAPQVIHKISCTYIGITITCCVTCVVDNIARFFPVLSVGRLKMQEWKNRHGSAGVENAGVVAMERQSNTKGSSTIRRQSSVFTDVATLQ